MSKYLAVPQGISLDRLVQHVRLPLFRNAYALMISTAATSALGLVYWILAARFYPPELVGVNAAVISLMTFLAGVAQHPSMSAMLRYLPIAGAKTPSLVRWAYLFSTTLAILIAGIFLVGINYFSPALGFLPDDFWLATWFLVGVVAWTIFALQDNVLTGLRKAIYVPMENIPYAIAKILLLIFLAARLTEYGILASWTFPLLVIMAPVNFAIFRYLLPKHVAATRDKIFTVNLGQIAYYISGNYIGALFMLAATRLLPVMVNNMAGSSANAYFYLPWTIATSLKLIIANMTTSFTVEVVNDDSKLRAYSRRFLLYTTGMIVPPALILFLGAPYILAFSGADYAEEGTFVMRMLTLAALPNILISLYLGIARVRQRVAGIITIQFVLCALTLGVSALWLDSNGIAGVGLAILVSECLVALVVLLTTLRPILWQPQPKR